MRYHKLQDLDISSILDVGAFKGEFSLRMRRMYPEASIFMVEANPSCEKDLKLTGIPYEICALHQKRGKKQFFFEKSNPICSGASFNLENTNFYQEDKAAYKILETYPLDDKNFLNGKIDLIKLDTQGTELNILKGGKQALQDCKYIVIEISLVEYNKNSPQIEETIDYLGSIGFGISDILDRLIISNQTIQMDFLFKRWTNI